MKPIIVIFLMFMWVNGNAEQLTLQKGETPPELDFGLLDVQKTGKTKWSALKNKVVVLDFWATWCAPCIDSIPKINALTERFEDSEVEFFSITYERPEKVREFLKKHPLLTNVGIDNNLVTFKAFKAWGIPMVIIVNGNGRIASVIHPDELNNRLLEQIIAGKMPDVKQHPGWPDPAQAEQYFRSHLEEKQ